MAIQEDTLGQSIFMNSADMVPKDHICHLVAAIINKMDVSEAEERFVGGPGYPAYPRKMLLRLLTMAAVDGMFSSRKIAKLARENVIYIHLTGNKQPDFRTICLFRAENADLVESTFNQIVLVARGLRIATLGSLSTDSTKIKANASRERSLSKEQIEWIREIIKKGIEIDKEEDKLYGDKRGDELPPELDTKEKIYKRIKEMEKERGKELPRTGRKLIAEHALGGKRNVKKALNKASKALEKSDQRYMSLTDTDSRLMPNKKGVIEAAYSTHVTVDLDSGIILSNDVVQESTDYAQMIPQIKNTERVVGRLAEGTKIINDYGYYTGRALRFLEKRGLDGYLPDKKQASVNKGTQIEEKFYPKEMFRYDRATTSFICPRGKRLKRRWSCMSRGVRRYQYFTEKCSKCPVKSKCTDREYRIISAGIHENEKQRMRAKMESKRGKATYRRRMLVEHSLGDIKQNFGFREFLTRGLKGVGTEFDLVCSAHNLKLIWSKIDRRVDRVFAAAATAAGAF